MKILLTTNVFFPESSAGTETLVHSTALALRQRGHKVLVVTGYPPVAGQDPEDRVDEYEVDAIPVVRYKRGKMLPGQEANPMRLQYVNRSFESGFRRVVEKFDPDVVHFHHLQRLSVTAIDPCLERRTPA